MGALGLWSFEPVVPWWGLVAVLALGGFLAWFQYLRFNVYGVSPRLRLTLFLIRLFLFAVITFLLAGPQWTRESRFERPPRMVVLFDTSESMNSAEAADKPTAFVRVRDAFRRTLFATWQDRFQMRLYTFNSKLTPIDPDQLWALENVGGSATDLRSAIVEALQQQGANTPTAIVMFTDGNHNWGPEPASDILKPDPEGEPVPLLAVTTPSYGELRQSLAIHEVTLPSPAFAKEPVEIRFQVAASGVDSQQGVTKLRIEQKLDNDEWDLIENGEQEREIPLLGSSNLGSFNTLFPEGGWYRVELEASAAGIDPVSAVREIQVEPGRWKVGLFAGSPSWGIGSMIRRIIYVPRYSLQAAIGRGEQEWAFLTAGIESEEELQKSNLLTIEEVATDTDLFIFASLSPDQYNDLPTDQIRESIEKGAAVLIIGGDGNPPPQARIDAMGVGPISPVSFGAAFSSHTSYDVEVTDLAAVHRSTRSQAFLNASEDLPRAILSYSKVEPASGAEVLLRFIGGEPGLVVRTAGQNRSAYIGATDLWRWQFQPGEFADRVNTAFLSLTDGLVKWLLVGDEETSEIPVLILSQSRVPIGKVLEIGVQYGRAVEYPETTVRLTVLDSNQVVQPLPVNKQPGGFFSAQFTPAEAGDYTIQVQDPAIPSASDEAVVSAEPFSIETAISGARTDLLQALAENSGGGWVDVEDVESLTSRTDLEKIYEPKVSTRILTEPLMSAPWILLILITVMGVEWYLRRTNDLP